MIKPLIIYKGDFTKQNIQLEFVNEKHYFRPELEAKLPELWVAFVEEAKRKGLETWDGSYIRLTNIDEFTKTWILKLSTIRYSRIRALSSLAKEIELKKEEYTYHLSTGAVIETSDNLYVMGQRG